MNPTPLAIALAVVLVAWPARYLYFRSRLERTRALFDQYGAMANTAQEEFGRRRTELMRRTHELHGLWKGAGLSDSTLTSVEIVAPFTLGSQQYSAQENWLTVNADVQTYVYYAFNRAIGYYEDRERAARNPADAVIWLVTIPQQFVRWMGGRGDDPLSKLLSVVWTGVVALSVILQLLGRSLLNLF